VSYWELLDELRHEGACAQLRNTDISIKELAFELGYSGSNNFIRAFKRLTGFTPSEYRE
jgi:AraC-like DNA-binding protein